MSNQIISFLSDFSGALQRAQQFDLKVQADASAISDDYASIAALSVRQAFGATELTISRNGDGSFDATDILMFMKGNVAAYSCPCRSSHVIPQRYQAMV